MVKTRRTESNRKPKKSRDRGRKKDEGWHFNECVRKKSMWFCLMHWRLDVPFAPFDGESKDGKSKDDSKKSKRSGCDLDNTYEEDSSKNNGLKRRKSH